METTQKNFGANCWPFLLFKGKNMKKRWKKRKVEKKPKSIIKKIKVLFKRIKPK